MTRSNSKAKGDEATATYFGQGLARAEVVDLDIVGRYDLHFYS